MKVGSLFAGVGGFDLAAEHAGMEVAWQSENDKHASVVLGHHWPGSNLGDIHDITIETEDWSGTATAVDVLVGGFPCQDYSVAGNRRGLAGDRGALWWEFLRLIDEGRPTWIVGENVPGLLSSRDGQDFATILDSLTECGYGVVWGVLDAQWFGVAQRRRRVFIVGHSGGRPQPEILALGEGMFGHPEPSRETREAVAATLEARPTGRRLRYEENHLIAFSAGQSKGAGTVAAAVELAPTLRAAASGSNQVPTIAFAQNQRDEVRDLGDLAGSLSADEGMKQRTYVTAPQVRRLTPLECQRLQGFPDDWYDGIEMSDAQKYRQLGNAVAVPVAEWIMKRIAAYEPQEEP